MAAGKAFIPVTPNFLGMLFNTNIHKTQFLSLIGGVEGNNALITTNPEFPVSVAYGISDGSQPAITETAAVGAASPTYFGLSQNTNVIQIFQEDITVSRLRERASGRLSGVNTAGETPERESEEALQIELHLQKMKRDMNYTAINGVFDDTGLTDATEVLATRGMLEAIVSNVIVGGLSVANINTMVRLAYDKGAFELPTLFVNSINKQNLSALFATAGLTEVERDRFTAGVAVEKLVTDFGDVYIVIDNDMPSDEVMLVDLPYVKPVFTRDKETGEIIVVKPLSQRGGYSYELYAEFGLDHGPEWYHGKLIVAEIKAWVTATAYALGDYVLSGGKQYVCIKAHTSATFATELAAKNWAQVGA